MPRKPLDGREHGGRLVVSGKLLMKPKGSAPKALRFESGQMKANIFSRRLYLASAIIFSVLVFFYSIVQIWHAQKYDNYTYASDVKWQYEGSYDTGSHTTGIDYYYDKSSKLITGLQPEQLRAIGITFSVKLSKMSYDELAPLRVHDTCLLIACNGLSSESAKDYVNLALNRALAQENNALLKKANEIAEKSAAAQIRQTGIFNSTLNAAVINTLLSSFLGIFSLIFAGITVYFYVMRGRP